VIWAALLWVPAEDFTAWRAVADALQKKEDVRVTVALSPSMIRPDVEAALQPFIDDRRVEVAARIEGDPWLPAVAAGRRHDVARRLVSTADAFRLAFAGAAVAGFVPAGGAWDPAWQPLLKGAGFRWAATGLPPWPADGLSVIDEALGPHRPGSFLEMLADPPRRRWLTLSEAFSVSSPTVSAPWTSSPLDTPEGSRLWAEYEQAAAAVRRYQNSGSADSRRLALAVGALHAAQSSAFYRHADEAGLRRQLDEALRAAGALSDEVKVSSSARSFRAEGDKLGLAVSWDDAQLSVTVRKPADLAPDAVIDVYVDVNGVPGAGRQQLLPGRSGALAARDSWEVALELSRVGAKLYRAGSPAAEVSCAVEAAAVQCSFPRSALRGNPGGWGYAVGAFPATGGDPIATLGPSLKAVRVRRPS